jgi:hypothetical protein
MAKVQAGLGRGRVFFHFLPYFFHHSLEIMPVTQFQGTIDQICAIFSNNSLVAASMLGGKSYVPSSTIFTVGEVEM